MNRKTAKALLENGVLQAYAYGEAIEVFSLVSPGWKESENFNFDREPECYRIKPKPKFKEGDLVKSLVNGRIGTVVAIVPMGVQINHLGDARYCDSVHHPNNLVHVKKVLKPHTFETAVKACAEHGIRLSKGIDERVLLGLHTSKCYWVSDTSGISVQGSSDYEALCTWVFFSNNTPFAQITYEEIE